MEYYNPETGKNTKVELKPSTDDPHELEPREAIRRQSDLSFLRRPVFFEAMTEQEQADFNEIDSKLRDWVMKVTKTS
jgi:hypothetical protein